MKRIVWFIFGWILIVTIAQATSFDCSKASTNIEKLICSDSALSKLDEDLSSIYKVELQNNPKSALIRHQQKQWIIERNSCSNTSCLKDQYNTRITQLSLANKSGNSLVGDKSDTLACQTVADYSNRGEIAKLRVPVDMKIQPKIKSLFGQLSGNTTLWFVDLNDDGVPDPFIINVDGTAYASNGHAISGDDLNIIVDIENADDDDIDLDLITVAGKYYVLSSNETNLSQLWRMKKERFEPICRFKKRDKHIVEISKGKETPVCIAASAGNIKHIDFKSVNNDVVDFNNSVIKGLAAADIFNDGEPIKIALVEYHSGAGRGSSSLMIRALDNEKPERTEHLHEILAHTFDGFNVKQNVFVYDGLTYIDETSTGVILIKNSKAEEVCHFKFHTLFEIDGG